MAGGRISREEPRDSASEEKSQRNSAPLPKIYVPNFVSFLSSLEVKTPHSWKQCLPHNLLQCTRTSPLPLVLCLLFVPPKGGPGLDDLEPSFEKAQLLWQVWESLCSPGSFCYTAAGDWKSWAPLKQGQLPSTFTATPCNQPHLSKTAEMWNGGGGRLPRRT